MNKMVYISDFELITPLGNDSAEFFHGLLSGRTAFSIPAHFEARGVPAGVIHALDNGNNSYSRAERLLQMLAEKSPHIVALPQNVPLFLATTVGAIDLIERGCVFDSCQYLLQKAGEIFRKKQCFLTSAACASGQSAVCAAAKLIKSGQCNEAVIIGCDICSEFVTSGFSSLGALSQNKQCLSYYCERDGLLLGEAAGMALLRGVSAEQTNEAKMIHVAAFDNSCDATHITAPDTSGKLLAAGIERALEKANFSLTDVGCIIGHGTGTKYNDIAELSAIRMLWNEQKIPLFSLKANVGHTLGATGILQLAAGCQILRSKDIPPQVSGSHPEPMAQGLIANTPRKFSSNARGILSINIGFGGINSIAALEVLS